MKRIMQISLMMVLVVLTCPMSRAALADDSNGPTVKLTPDRIEMATFYDGAELRIEGMAAEGTQVVIVLKGPEVEEVFNKKGRLGPIWVNSGKVHISGIPSLFLSFSPRPVEELLSREAIDQYQLDETAIRNQMKVEPSQQDQEKVRANYLSLKTQQGIYRVVSDGIKMGAPTQGGAPFTLDLRWPKKAPPAHYVVHVYECKDNQVLRQSTVPLSVEEVGFPAKMAYLAKDRAVLYGIIAVIVAMVAGFGIDFLASLLGKRGVSAH